MNRILAKAWELWLALFLLFGLHRAFSFPYLADKLLLGRQNPWLIYLNGLLSDFWMAALAAVLYALSAPILKLWRGEKAADHWALVWVGILGFATALHQPYLEFFRFQFIPLHARYLFDAEFVVASLSSVLNPRAWTLAAVAGLGVWVMSKRRNRTRLSPRMGAVLFALALALATIGHAVNIHYKVQLFVPTELQVHFLERFAQHLAVPSDPKPLTQDERAALTVHLGAPPLSLSEFDGWMRRPAGDARLNALAQEIKEGFEDSVVRGEKPLLLTVLLESSRFVDAGRDEATGATITPALDQLVATGLSFPLAYSTGMVTRGGQEAVWCGHLSNVATSMMRDRPEVKLDCLPRLFSRRFGVESFWLHGGRGEFDGQEHFWTTQGVERLLVSKDFPASVPTNGWGVSDRALFQRSLGWMQDHQTILKGPFLNGMILTLTNHTPFTLPEDSPLELKAEMDGLSENNFRTTRYTDFALGEWVDGLKKAGLWKKALIVIMSDHGVAGVPFHRQWREHPNFEEEAMSRVNLVVTGGLTEEALSRLKRTHFKWPTPVSQAQVAPFLAHVVGAGEERFIGDHLLAEEGRLPIVSDFGPKVYFPLARAVLKREDLMGAPKTSDLYGPAFYRAFLLWMNAFNVVM